MWNLKGSIKRLLLGSGRPIDQSIYTLYEGAVMCVQEGVEREAKLKGENALLRHALDRAKRINASGVLPSVAELHEKGHVADSWLEGESYGFDRCREGVTLLIDEVLASCADAPE